MLRFGSRLLTVIRAIALVVHLASPLLIPVAVVFRLPGTIAVMGLAVVAVAVLAFRVEGLIRRLHRASPEGPARGLARSLERVSGLRKKRPMVLVYPDPLPNALVVRGLGGRGQILLSQGMLALLPEAELRVVLSWGLESLDTPGVVLRSVAAYLASSFVRLAPQNWVRSLLRGKPLDNAERSAHPVYFLWFAVVYQYARIFIRLAGVMPMGESTRAALDSSRRRVESTAPLSSGGVRAGLGGLYLFRPWAGRAILPLESAR